MIDINEVINSHARHLKTTGGADGLRDRGSLESAISRTLATLDGFDLYVDVYEKSAAVLESILKNHLFIYGYKRIAYIILEFLLFKDQAMIAISEEKQYPYMIQITTGI